MEPVTHAASRPTGFASGAFFTSVFFVLAAMLSGCGESGPAKYPVSGVVSYNGRTLPTGTVMFVPEEGGPPAVSTIAADGSYRLEAVAGRHRVGVTAVPPPPPGANEMNYRPQKPLLPDKFGRPDTSGLSVEVQPENDNQIDIKMP